LKHFRIFFEDEQLTAANLHRLTNVLSHRRAAESDARTCFACSGCCGCEYRGVRSACGARRGNVGCLPNLPESERFVCAGGDNGAPVG
jgi:hypothetical protein